MNEKYNNKRNVIFNPNKAQRWNEEKNTIISTPPEYIDIISKPFTYLRKNALDGTSSFEEVKEATSIVKKEELAKVKRLELEKKAGYVAFSTLTVIGVLLLGIVIFTIVKSIVG